MMISPTAYKLNGADWAKTHPIGTGPYMLKSFVRDTSVEFVKNPNYWQPGKPYMDGIKYVVLADATAARMAFEAGQMDVLQAQLGDTANALKAKGAKVESRPGTIATLIPDSKNPASPFAKKAVREAVEYAIDRPTLSSTLGFGYWEAENQVATTFEYGYNKDLVGRAYDPAKAKAKLIEAGYPAGTGPTITINTSSIYNVDPPVAYMNYLNAVGFKCTVNTMTQAAWTTMSTGGWTNSLFFAPLAVTDAEYVSYLDRYYSASSLRYPVLAKPQTVTDTITQALYEQDYTKRVALAQKAVQLIQDDCTAIPIYHGPSLAVEKAYVMDANFGSLAGLGFRWDSVNVWLNK
jgi:ABC-type transport system substrate-binding protein